jgi:hypothetical protein
MTWPTSQSSTAPILEESNAAPRVFEARFQSAVVDSSAVAEPVPGKPLPLRPNDTSTPTAERKSLQVLSPIPTPKSEARHDPSFVTTARWEGVVLERFSTYFSSEVVDLISGESAYAEFELLDVSKADVALCEPGGLFYWAIGYRVEATGQRARSSVLTFRRMGRISQ